MRIAARGRKRGGWAGSGSFEFNVERYIHLPTGKYFSIDSDEVPSDVDQSPEWDYQEIPLTITGRGYFTPGYVTGLPEDCYPDEGDLEIESVEGPDGSDWTDFLTKSEKENAEERLEAFCKDQNDDYDNY